MLDTRTQARLTKNCTDAAVGYANASAAAWQACAQQALSFWGAPFQRPSAPAQRDHLSWFNPHGSSPLWLKQPEPPPPNPWAIFFSPATWGIPAPAPQPAAPQLAAMSWAFAPFAVFWGTALRGPTFAWPMAYSMIANGVPDSVAWPVAEANAAVIDAASTINEQAHAAFATYQSAGGFAMAHILPSKDALKAMAVLMPIVSVLPMAHLHPALV